MFISLLKHHIIKCLVATLGASEVHKAGAVNIAASWKLELAGDEFLGHSPNSQVTSVDHIARAERILRFACLIDATELSHAIELLISGRAVLEIDGCLMEVVAISLFAVICIEISVPLKLEVKVTLICVSGDLDALHAEYRALILRVIFIVVIVLTAI